MIFITNAIENNRSIIEIWENICDYEYMHKMEFVGKTETEIISELISVEISPAKAQEALSFFQELNKFEGPLKIVCYEKFFFFALKISRFNKWFFFFHAKL